MKFLNSNLDYFSSSRIQGPVWVLLRAVWVVEFRIKDLEFTV